MGRACFGFSIQLISPESYSVDTVPPPSHNVAMDRLSIDLPAVVDPFDPGVVWWIHDSRFLASKHADCVGSVVVVWI